MAVRSMVDPLRRVAVRPPSAVGDYSTARWSMPLDMDELLAEHAAFVGLLHDLGCEVEMLPAVDDMPDACFVYDPAFVTGRGVIEFRSAKAVRAGEPPLLAGELAARDVETIGRLSGAATADGGDMFWLDEHTLAIGRSYRTNQVAVDQISAILAEEDATVEVFDVPHDQGPDYCLHLMSVVSPIRADLAVVYQPLAPVALIQALRTRGIEILALPPRDYATLGCNILTIEPGVVVMAHGNSATKQALEDRGVRVHEYRATQINKGEGGPTCLTRPLDRSG